MRKLIALAAALALCAPVLFAETAITVRAGGKTMRGILYDTPLAREIAARFPLTVAMSGWGGREFYGSPDFTPLRVSWHRTGNRRPDILKTSAPIIVNCKFRLMELDKLEFAEALCRSLIKAGSLSSENL